MKIGKGVSIAPDVVFDPMFPELIELGDGCLLGWGTRIFTHEYSLDTIRVKSVRLGVTISDDVTTASCSFVNKPISRKGLHWGIPAKLIKAEHEAFQLSRG